MASEALKVRSNLSELCMCCSRIITSIQGVIPDLQVTPSIMNIGANTVDAISEIEVTERFITRTVNWWPLILQRDETFLISHINEIFSELPDIYIKDLKKILGTQHVDKHEKITLWKILQGTVKCSIRHIHNSRSPQKIDGKITYRATYCPEIRLKDLAHEWDIVL